MTAETKRGLSLSGKCTGASMEPRSFDRGDSSAAHDSFGHGPASMEPRSFDRGDHTAGNPAHFKGKKLQWSRGLLTAETSRVIALKSR